MNTDAWGQSLADVQASVEDARDALRAARDARASVVAAAHREGLTIYAIAKHLGVTQNAVRRMLGL